MTQLQDRVTVYIKESVLEYKSTHCFFHWKTSFTIKKQNQKTPIILIKVVETMNYVKANALNLEDYIW